MRRTRRTRPALPGSPIAAGRLRRHATQPQRGRRRRGTTPADGRGDDRRLERQHRHAAALSSATAAAGARSARRRRSRSVAAARPGVSACIRAQSGEPQKQEGDGRAPAGVFRIGTAFGYADSARPALPYQAMTASDYCIDVNGSPLYNRIVDADAGRRRRGGRLDRTDAPRPARRRRPALPARAS